MRYVSGFTRRSQSLRWSRVLLVAALCGLLGAALCVALAPPVAEHTQAPSAVADAAVTAAGKAPAAPAALDLLAAWSADSGARSGACAADVLSAGPEFLATTGTCTDAECRRVGKLCCRACGFPGCTNKACLTPLHGKCPLIP